MSKSVLSRLELSQQVVSLEQLVQMDRAWHKEGTLVSLGQQLLGMPEPLAGTESSVWMHNFPAAWSGPVWELVRPTPTSPPADTYDVQMKWGAWDRSTSVEPSTTLEHGKGDDGASYTMTLLIDPPAHVVFGIGTPPPSWPVQRVNDQWQFVGDERPVIERFQARMRQIFALSGRTPEELAEFLNLPTDAVLYILGVYPFERGSDRSPKSTD